MEYYTVVALAAVLDGRSARVQTPLYYTTTQDNFVSRANRGN